MVSLIDNKEKAMATDAIAAGGDEPRKPESAQAATSRGGFFHIYKRGQGYWTRMGSAAGAALIAALTLYFLYGHLPVWVYPMFDPTHKLPVDASAEARSMAIAHAQSVTKITSLSICGAFLIAYGLLVFYLLNKPVYADFLIATDSEMKKVNWTSRKELFGSTKIVIIFMFLIAGFLFLLDIDFGEIFYYLGVLKYRPLGDVSKYVIITLWSVQSFIVTVALILMLRARFSGRRKF